MGGPGAARAPGRDAPLECIVRGRLAGQAYDEYAASGTVHGTPMPAGLQLADRFPEPIFTPSTKAEEGHDLNIGFDAAVDLVGLDAATTARELSLALFRRAAERAAAAGFVLADTKFELGLRRRCPQPVRRGRHAGLVAAVAGRPDRPRPDAAGVRQAAIARLGVGRRLGQAAAPAPAAAGRRRGRRPSATVAAYERVTGRRLADWYGAAR